jgi:hypothetical protein
MIIYPPLLSIYCFIVKVDVKSLQNEILKLLGRFVLDVFDGPQLVFDFIAHRLFSERVVVRGIHFVKLKLVLFVAARRRSKGH